MFFAGSRYEKAPTQTVTGASGKQVTAVVIPLDRPATRLLGFHRRTLGQRLDHLAAHYLADPNGFWRLCDANEAFVPDTLAAHDMIGIPMKG